MKIEGGFNWQESFQPKSNEKSIEGKMETSFKEINLRKAIPMSLPPEIKWSDARLIFKEVGEYNKPEGPGMYNYLKLYAGVLEYEDKKGETRKSVLSLMTSKDKPILFTGTKNGFYAHDPLSGGREDPFYIVGLQVKELKENESRLSALWHELGHIMLYDTNADIQLFQAAVTSKAENLPKIAMIESYYDNLRKSIPYGYLEQNGPSGLTRKALSYLEITSGFVEKSMTLFHERNAWAVGMSLIRKNSFPTGFEKVRSYYEYALLCLSSYADYYGDKKFVNGWRKVFK